MLSTRHSGERGPRIVLLHWLGGSSRTWSEVSERVAAAGFRCSAVDLPGFGSMAGGREFGVAEMVRGVAETIADLRKGELDQPWLLAGHSMGGKLAAILCRAFEEGTPGLEDLRGLVLLSPSPPGPEPMPESKREAMLRDLGPGTRDTGKRRTNAGAFVDDNTGRLPLLDAVQERTVEDVLRMNPEALVAWLTEGSREDWAKPVGRLRVPALILAGTEEEALGPEAQMEHTLPHFAQAKVIALEGGGHLGPLERPWEVADRMLEFFKDLGLEHEPAGATLSDAARARIVSDRTSPQTRKVLLERLHDVSDDPLVLDKEELRTLRALAARVIPDTAIDLAARLDRALARSQHDGWRFSALPEDGHAWKQGLASLDEAAERRFGVPFVALDAARQDEMLTLAQGGDLGRGLLASLTPGKRAGLFDAEQMRAWFQDVRGELVKLYVADPRTMDRIGFTGFADERGFTKIKLGETEEAVI